LKIKHIQPGDGVLANVSSMASHALVAATAKRFSSLTGEDDHADGGTLPANQHGVDHLVNRQRRKRIVHLRPVDADPRYTLVLMEKNFFVFLDRFPVVV